jgi:hypothetical protein
MDRNKLLTMHLPIYCENWFRAVRAPGCLLVAACEERTGMQKDGLEKRCMLAPEMAIACWQDGSEEGGKRKCNRLANVMITIMRRSVRRMFVGMASMALTMSSLHREACHAWHTADERASRA